MSAPLQKSIEQYLGIVAHIQRLDQVIASGDVEGLQGFVLTLQELQEEAGLNDAVLMAEIARNPGRWQANPLFRQRMQLLEQIVEMNDLLLPRIHGMMSVTVAEMAQLKGGRAAVSGYHPDAGRPKKSVRGVG